MNQIIIPTPQTTETSRLQVSVHIQAEVLSAETIRKQANVWLLEHVGNLLRAETPELVLGNQLMWRMDIILTSPTRGWLGRLSRLEMDAITGEVLTDQDTLVQEITTRAQTLATN